MTYCVWFVGIGTFAGISSVYIYEIFDLEITGELPDPQITICIFFNVFLSKNVKLCTFSFLIISFKLTNWCAIIVLGIRYVYKGSKFLFWTHCVSIFICMPINYLCTYNKSASIRTEAHKYIPTKKYTSSKNL